MFIVYIKLSTKCRKKISLEGPESVLDLMEYRSFGSSWSWMPPLIGVDGPSTTLVLDAFPHSFNSYWVSVLALRIFPIMVAGGGSSLPGVHLAWIRTSLSSFFFLHRAPFFHILSWKIDWWLCPVLSASHFSREDRCSVRVLAPS